MTKKGKNGSISGCAETGKTRRNKCFEPTVGLAWKLLYGAPERKTCSK